MYIDNNLNTKVHELNVHAKYKPSISMQTTKTKFQHLKIQYTYIKSSINQIIFLFADNTDKYQRPPNSNAPH